MFSSSAVGPLYTTGKMALCGNMRGTPAKMESLRTCETDILVSPGEMLGLGMGISAGCLCLLLTIYVIAQKIR